MNNYEITFTRYYTYSVEAENEDEAYKKAHEEFYAEVIYPIVNTIYDDCEIWLMDERESEE